MTELQRLLTAYDAELKNGRQCALATVVKVEGSAYRRPGARMLITDTGQLTGTISGGCLEGDARLRAQQVMLRGKPEIVIYDSTDLDDDLENGAQLGCQGKVYVLIEPLSATAKNTPLVLRQAANEQQTVILATILESSTANLYVGQTFLYNGTGWYDDALIGHVLERKLTGGAIDALAGHGDIARYESGTQHISVFFELIKPAPQLTVFGAGNDVKPLLRMAVNLGWRVTIIDGRLNLATSTRFPEANLVQCVKVDELQNIDTADGYAVLMSHNYFYDLAALRCLNHQPGVTYIGMLGPRKKAMRMFDDLRADGIDTATLEAKLYGPVGIDIGAEAAEEIAVSIMAELVAVRSGHPAGFLRNLDGPIHQQQKAIQDA